MLKAGLLERLAQRKEPKPLAEALDRRPTLAATVWERWAEARDEGETPTPRPHEETPLIEAAHGDERAEAAWTGSWFKPTQL